MSDGSLYYRGWPYSEQPTPAEVRDAEIVREQEEIDSAAELEQLRGILVRLTSTNFCSSATTVDELLHAIDMTIGEQ